MKTYQNLTVRILAAMILLAGLQQLRAATIISVNPANGATGVPIGSSVVFTFSTAMDPAQTSASFIDLTASESLDAASVWSAGNTVLTLTPSPQFANNHNIEWGAGGQDTLGNPLTGTLTGSFTTIAGVNGGSGSESNTTFAVGRYAYYQQVSSSPGAFLTYEFFAQTLLRSNRTATAITFTIPVTGGVSNLEEDGIQPEKFDQTAFNPNQTTLSNKFPSGNYVFNVTSVQSNQQVTVNLPSLPWPNEPVITNYTAAQSIDPSQPFTLKWNTFTNGTSADWVLLLVSDSQSIPVFQTPNFGTAHFLNGTSNSVAIPANTLAANTNFSAELVFYHVNTGTNGLTITDSFVASIAVFNLATIGGSSGPPPQLTIVPSGSNVLLEWPTNSTGYTLEFTNSTPAGAWSTTLPAPVVVGTNNVVTTGLSGTQRYFRLIK